MMNEKHIKLKNNKIVYASDELKYILSAFYFGYYANEIMKMVDNAFLSKLIHATTISLDSIGVSWDDIPEDNSDWGVVLDFINQQKDAIKKENNDGTPKPESESAFRTTENDGRRIDQD